MESLGHIIHRRGRQRTDIPLAASALVAQITELLHARGFSQARALSVARGRCVIEVTSPGEAAKLRLQHRVIVDHITTLAGQMDGPAIQQIVVRVAA